VRVDPCELFVELLGREGERAQHAEAARVGDGRHHVTAVAEREQGELDAEGLADGSAHAGRGLRGCLH
jgi:hypothetical protein